MWLVTLGGCAHDEILPPLPYSVYHDPAFVPTECRRLVLLPLENESPFPGAEEELRQVLAQELRQWGAFEVFVPPCDSIPRNAADGGPLSDAALTELAARYQADAFLMGRLTVFHPYRPMRIGASLSLLGVRNATTLAAIDGVWTAPSESVSRARTELLHEPTEMAAADSRTRAASSPRQLMQVLSQDAFQAFQAAPALVLPPDAPTY